MTPKPIRVPPYPPSTSLAGLEWLTASSRYPGTNSDMHWWTWGDDGELYFVDDDGHNFGLPWNFAHLLKATGTPPHHTVTEISAFPELARPDALRYRRYVDGALAVGSRLFVAAYDYDDSAAEERGYEFRHVDRISPHGGVASLMFSDDYGRTWHNAPEAREEGCDYFLGERFAGLAFVGFGPGYTGLPERFGNYVYAISNDSNWETGDSMFVARVPRDRILDRSAWEFYAGGDPEDPDWVDSEERAAPALSNPGAIGHPTMTYDAGLGRFLLTFNTDSVPHSLDTSFEEAKRSWDKQSELYVLEGASPWGPFGLVHFDGAWEYPHMPYLPQVPAKWLSEDRLEGWMVFSGDYTVPAAQRGREGFEDYYGFVTRKFRLHRT